MKTNRKFELLQNCEILKIISIYFSFNNFIFLLTFSFVRIDKLSQKNKNKFNCYEIVNN